MGFEDNIKLKHKFEESFRDLLKYVSVMTYEEIELGLSRMIDNLNELGEKERQNVEMKIKLIITYLEARKFGVIKRKKTKRIKVLYKKQMDHFFIEHGKYKHKRAMKNYHEQVDRQTEIYNQKLKEYDHAIQMYNKKLHNMPLLKQLFCACFNVPTRPQIPQIVKPQKPNSEIFFIDELRDSATLSDFFVWVLSTYKLNTPPYDLNYSVVDIKRFL